MHMSLAGKQLEACITSDQAAGALCCHESISSIKQENAPLLQIVQGR